jgi:hypothetical protein
MNMKHASHIRIRDENTEFQSTITGVPWNPTNGAEMSNCYEKHL